MSSRAVWRVLFVGIAAVLFAVAFHFGEARPYQEMRGAAIGSKSGTISENVAIAPNQVAGLAAFGFALSGGLALLAAAVVRGEG